jgi:hypothetical protein
LSTTAADRQHFLLAAGELAAAVVLALGEAGKQRVDARDGPRAGPLVRHLQVFLDAEVGEDAPALGHVADAAAGDAVGRPARGFRAENRDAALTRRRQADEATQRRGLAGTVAAKQRRDPAFRDVEADAVKNVALAVVGVEATGL